MNPIMAVKHQLKLNKRRFECGLLKNVKGDDCEKDNSQSLRFQHTQREQVIRKLPRKDFSLALVSSRFTETVKPPAPSNPSLLRVCITNTNLFLFIKYHWTAGIYKRKPLGIKHIVTTLYVVGSFLDPNYFCIVFLKQRCRNLSVSTCWKLHALLQLMLRVWKAW